MTDLATMLDDAGGHGSGGMVDENMDPVAFAMYEAQQRADASARAADPQYTAAFTDPASLASGAGAPGAEDPAASMSQETHANPPAEPAAPAPRPVPKAAPAKPVAPAAKPATKPAAKPAPAVHKTPTAASHAGAPAAKATAQATAAAAATAPPQQQQAKQTSKAATNPPQQPPQPKTPEKSTTDATPLPPRVEVLQDGKFIEAKTAPPGMSLGYTPKKPVNYNDRYRQCPWYFGNIPAHEVIVIWHETTKGRLKGFKPILTHPGVRKNQKGKNQNFHMGVQFPLMILEKHDAEPFGTHSTFVDTIRDGVVHLETLKGSTHPSRKTNRVKNMKHVTTHVNHDFHVRLGFQTISQQLPQFQGSKVNLDYDGMNKEQMDCKQWVQDVNDNVERNYIFHPFERADKFLVAARSVFFLDVSDPFDKACEAAARRNQPAPLAVQFSHPDMWALHTEMKSEEFTKLPEAERVSKQKVFDTFVDNYVAKFRSKLKQAKVSDSDVSVYRTPFFPLATKFVEKGGKMLPAPDAEIRPVLEVKTHLFKDESAIPDGDFRMPMPESQKYLDEWVGFFNNGPFEKDGKDTNDQPITHGKWRHNDIPCIMRGRPVPIKERPPGRRGDVASYYVTMSYTAFSQQRVGTAFSPYSRYMWQRGPTPIADVEAETLDREALAMDIDPDDELTSAEDREYGKLFAESLKKQGGALFTHVQAPAGAVVVEGEEGGEAKMEEEDLGEGGAGGGEPLDTGSADAPAPPAPSPADPSVLAVAAAAVNRKRKEPAAGVQPPLTAGPPVARTAGGVGGAVGAGGGARPAGKARGALMAPGMQ